MSPTRTRGMTTVSRAAAIAEQLHHECSILLELFRNKESFPTDMTVADGRLVSVQLPSAQLEPKDKVWCLHSALFQCHGLMEQAISKEEGELGSGKMGDYEKQRKMVKERLLLLLANTAELLKSAGDSALTTSSVGPEVECPTFLFELKLWVYRVYKELDFWVKTSISTLQTLPSNIQPVGARRVRSTISTRR